MGKRSLTVFAVVWIVVMAAGISATVTMSICGVGGAALQANAGEEIVVTAEEYALIERYARLDEIRGIIKSDFYQDVPEDTLVTGAVRGMLASVEDDYTFYYTPEEMSSMNEQTQGVYEGLGLLLSGDKDGRLTVLRVFKDSPAQRAGILAGDRILTIEGETVGAETSKDVDAAVALVKTAQSERIALTLLRGGVGQVVEVARDTININRVEYQMLDDGVGYMAIYEFMGDDVQGVREALDYFRAQNARALVIDLRSNPGGLLTDVVEIADMLLPEGLVVYVEDRAGRRDNYYSDAARYDVPMAVLVNGMSASASEILAASLQYYGVATVVGETTFGKGIVQTVIPFRSDGAGMQLTTARYYTPAGVCIHKIGVSPDLPVALDEGYDAAILHADPENDSQLRAALAALEE